MPSPDVVYRSSSAITLPFCWVLLMLMGAKLPYNGTLHKMVGAVIIADATPCRASYSIAV